jgi:hypothetical protein
MPCGPKPDAAISLIDDERAKLQDWAARPTFHWCLAQHTRIVPPTVVEVQASASTVPQHKLSRPPGADGKARLRPRGPKAPFQGSIRNISISPGNGLVAAQE